MANQLTFALPRATDANGDPAAGALAYFYQAGTTTPVTVYSDDGLTTPHSSPLVADSGGLFAQVFYGGATLVKAVIQGSGGGALYTLDPCPMVSGASSAAEDVSYSPNSNNAATNVQDALDNLADDVAATVPESRTITAGTGLTGGGTLDANRTLAVDMSADMYTDRASTTKVPQMAAITAQLPVAWCAFTGSGSATITESYGVTSVVRTGTGAYTVTLSNAMSGTGYCVVPGSNTNELRVVESAITTTSFGLLCKNSSGTDNDANYASFVVYGALA